MWSHQEVSPLHLTSESSTDFNYHNTLHLRLTGTFSSKISKVVWSALSYLLLFSPNFLSSVPLTAGPYHYSCILPQALQHTVHWPTSLLTNPLGKSYFSWKILDFSSHTLTRLYFTFSNRHLGGQNWLFLTIVCPRSSINLTLYLGFQ